MMANDAAGSVAGAGINSNTPVRRTECPRKPNIRFVDYEMEENIDTEVTTPLKVIGDYKLPDVINEELPIPGGSGVWTDDIKPWKSSFDEDEDRKESIDENFGTHNKLSEATEVTANCPVCGVSVPERNINWHLDACLQQTEDENIQVSVPERNINWQTEKEKTPKVKFSRKMETPDLHTISSSEDSNDSLPDLHTRLSKNVPSNLYSQKSALTTFMTHTLSSDDEKNADSWKKKVLDDVNEDDISIIEDFTQANTSKGHLNVILDDAPDIECYGSPTVTSKSSSQTSLGVRSSGWSTFDTRSIGSSSSFGDREMEKENFGIKRNINCLDEDDDLPIIHDASVNLESNPVLLNHKENYMDVLPVPKKAMDKKLRSEEIREEKAEKKRQREALKQQRDADKARLKAQKEAEKTASRQFKPGECMKHMVINIDRRLIESVAGSQIISQLQAAELRYRVVDHAVHSAITLVRVDPLSQCEHLEEEGVVVMDVENFVTAVWQQVYGGTAASTGGLTSLYRDLVHKLKIKRLTLVVYDIETYFRGNKNTNNRQFRANVLGEEADGASKKGKKKKSQSVPENIPKVSRIDIESALVTAQLECGLNHRLFGSPEKVGLFVTQLTKAVAEAPHKREKKESTFSWYAEGSSVSTIKVDKTGVGLLKLWLQQLRQFNNVGVELAQAIAREYPSPQELVQAYRRCDTTAAASMLLSDILVRRSTGPLSSTRRIGPELSKKVHMFLTSTDPDVNLALK